MLILVIVKTQFDCDDYSFYCINDAVIASMFDSFGSSDECDVNSLTIPMANFDIIIFPHHHHRHH